LAKNVEREREDERIMQQLELEFSKMDANQDGTITQDELENFL